MSVWIVLSVDGYVRGVFIREDDARAFMTVVDCLEKWAVHQ